MCGRWESLCGLHAVDFRVQLGWLSFFSATLYMSAVVSHTHTQKFFVMVCFSLSPFPPFSEVERERERENTRIADGHKMEKNHWYKSISKSQLKP